eukprot:gene3448-6097_t
MSLTNTLKKVFKSIFPTFKIDREPDYFVGLEELFQIEEHLLLKLIDLNDIKFIMHLQKKEILLDIFSYILNEKEGKREKDICFSILVSPIGIKYLSSIIIELYSTHFFKYCIEEENEKRIYENLEFIKILSTYLEDDSIKYKLLNYLYSNQYILKYFLKNVQKIEMKQFFILLFSNLNNSKKRNSLMNKYKIIEYNTDKNISYSNNQLQSQIQSHQDLIINSSILYSSICITKQQQKEEFILILINQLFIEETTQNSMLLLQDSFSDHLISKSDLIISNILNQKNEEIIFYSLKVIELILSKCDYNYDSNFILFIFKSLKSLVNTFLKKESIKYLNLNSIQTTNLNINNPLGLLRLNLIEFFLNLIRSIKYLKRISNNKFSFFLIESEFLQEITNLYFIHEQNDILHSFYYKIISIIFFENDKDLIHLIFNECKLEYKILEYINQRNYLLNGHLLLLIEKIESLHLNKIKGWNEVVLLFYKENLNIQNKKGSLFFNKISNIDLINQKIQYQIQQSQSQTQSQTKSDESGDQTKTETKSDSQSLNLTLSQINIDIESNNELTEEEEISDEEIENDKRLKRKDTGIFPIQ